MIPVNYVVDTHTKPMAERSLMCQERQEAHYCSLCLIDNKNKLIAPPQGLPHAPAYCVCISNIPKFVPSRGLCGVQCPSDGRKGPDGSFFFIYLFFSLVIDTSTRKPPGLAFFDISIIESISFFKLLYVYPVSRELAHGQSNRSPKSPALRARERQTGELEVE